MRLHSPNSAILSAVIFNALIIIALIPLALRGVVIEPIGALAILQRNLLIYGVGGIIMPFVGIKVIDMTRYSITPRYEEPFSLHFAAPSWPRLFWPSCAAGFIHWWFSDWRQAFFP